VNGFTADEAAKVAGHHRWTEMRLFEVMGGWVQAVPELEVKIHLHTGSHRHAWHAELWRQPLAASPGAAEDGLTVPPGDGTEGVLDALSELAGGTATLEKLVGLYRVVLPRRVATCRQHRETASVVGDGPVIRVLDLVLGEEEAGWRQGELLLQSLVRTAEDVHQAAAHQARMESMLLHAAPGAP
jgi:hypothetical protein